MESAKRTSQAFIWTHFFKAPFWAMYTLLIFILCKDLEATPLQITLLITLKPVVSLFSPYWSALVHKRPDRLKSNVILGSVIGHLPFFFFPFVENPWFVIGAGALFLMMKRGILPAWMEILKQNLPKEKQQRTFSYGSTLSFVGGALLPILFGYLMDHQTGSWRMLFPLTSTLSLLATLLLLRIPMPKTPLEKPPPFNLKAIFLRPWKNTWHLFKTRPDFNRYQLGFMLGGGGLMVMQPALPNFFVHELGLSYTALAAALATCKGIGFALTSRTWAAWMDKTGLFRFSALVTAIAALFPLALLLAPLQISWVYIAYLIYGVMQAGSELSWHLSGPTFAREEDSSAYSSVNVVTVGVRGLFAPTIGALLCSATSAKAVLLLGGAFCILASLQLYRAEAKTTSRAL